MGNGSAQDRITEQGLRDFERWVRAGEAFRAAHAHITVWQQMERATFEEQEDFGRFTHLEPPWFMSVKRNRTDPRVRDLLLRAKALSDWGDSLGGFDEGD